jgi:hypothetical protein
VDGFSTWVVGIWRRRRAAEVRLAKDVKVASEVRIIMDGDVVVTVELVMPALRVDREAKIVARAYRAASPRLRPSRIIEAAYRSF